jgi:hypothetical protein
MVGDFADDRSDHRGAVGNGGQLWKVVAEDITDFRLHHTE